MKKTFLMLLGLLILSGLILVACGSPAPAPEAPAEEMPNTPLPPPTPTPTEEPSPAPETILSDTGEISEWTNAVASLTLVSGERLEYWDYISQKWVKLQIISTNPLDIAGPTTWFTAADPFYVGFPGYYVIIQEYKPQPLTHLWLKVEGNTIKVTSGGLKRLRKVIEGNVTG